MNRFTAAFIIALSSSTLLAAPDSTLCSGLAKEMSKILEDDRLIIPLPAQVIKLQQAAEKAKEEGKDIRFKAWALGGVATYSAIQTVGMTLLCGFHTSSVVDCWAKYMREATARGTPLLGRIISVAPVIAVATAAGSYHFFQEGKKKLVVSQEKFDRATEKLAKFVEKQELRKEILKDQINENGCFQ